MADSKNLIMYGTRWCGDCRKARKILESKHIEYEWINIDQDAEAEKYVIKINNGFRSVPTILFLDETILVEPSEKVLISKLSELNLI
jgi:mycoredoxin